MSQHLGIIMAALLVTAVSLTFWQIGYLMGSQALRNEQADISSIPWKYTVSSQHSFTIQKGKMYRMFDHVVLGEDLSVLISGYLNPSEEFSVDEVTITQVGMVGPPLEKQTSPLYHVQGVNDKIDPPKEATDE